jgi:hypothetical protein
VRAIVAALFALSLSGCIDSSGSILSDSQPLFGQRLRLQLYGLRKGYAHDPDQARFKWNGALYAQTGGGMNDVVGFSIHPFEAGDYIIQSMPKRQPRNIEYSLMHKLADGVYQVIAIDEDDADASTRAANCKHPGGAACRIETREQLYAFGRATAARRKDDGGLAIRLPDEPEPPAKRRPQRQQ